VGMVDEQTQGVKLGFSKIANYMDTRGCRSAVARSR